MKDGRWRVWQAVVTAALVMAASGINLADAADEGAVESSPDWLCEVVPLADHQISMRLSGIEKARWHFGPQYPRPFFFPFVGPSGTSLTRMGHPGAPDHDHHRSIWFAHHQVDGIDFWSDQTAARIRQKQWYDFRDGASEGVLATLLGWYDETGVELMEQDLIAALIPLEDNEHALEIQLTLRPATGADRVELDQTNFGFLAVRVAKSLSTTFGDGLLTSSEGAVGEAAIFAQTARWMDYSGSIWVGTGPARAKVIEGVTYFDHPDNPRYPTCWHVRSDGWMGAAFCLREAYTVRRDSPLTLRYLLHAHAGPYDAEKASRTAEAFRLRPAFEIAASPSPHRHFEVRRRAGNAP